MALGRIMIGFGLLALLALAGSALVGYGAFGPVSDLQPAHSLTGFAAVLLAVFADGWLVLFLWGSGRALRRAGDAGPGAGGAIAVGILAILAFVITFVLGHLVLTRHDPVMPHHVLWLVTFVLQAAALGLGGRALTASDRRAAELASPPAAPLPTGTPDAA